MHLQKRSLYYYTMTWETLASSIYYLERAFNEGQVEAFKVLENFRESQIRSGNIHMKSHSITQEQILHVNMGIPAIQPG